MFLDFPLLILKAQSSSQFTLFFIVMNAFFIIFGALAIFYADTLFQDAKNGRLKDTDRNIVRFLSGFLVVFINLLQVPMITMYG